MEFETSIGLKDLATIGGVMTTCIWSVLKIKNSIEGVKVSAEKAITNVQITAEKTAALLGKDIQHLTSAINEFKVDQRHLKNDQISLDKRVARLEFTQDNNGTHNGHEEE